MKKRLIAMLLVLCTLLGLLAGCGKKQDANPDAVGDEAAEEAAIPMTRGEWVMALAQSFGTDQSSTTTPYFSDVTSRDELFSYVQAEMDWDMLAPYVGSGKLEPDETLTVGDAAAMAAIAAGWRVNDSQYASDGSFDGTGALGFAREKGIISSSQDLDAELTVAQADAICTAARAAYFDVPVQEQMDVELNRDVIDPADTPIGTFTMSGKNAYLANGSVKDVYVDNRGDTVVLVDTANGTVELKEGAVFFTDPTREHPSGVARKISSMDVVNGEIVFETTTPELCDVYEELSVHTTVSADPSNIVWANGVSATVLPDEDGGFEVCILGEELDTAPKADYLDDHKILSGFTQKIDLGSGSFSKNWTNTPIEGGNPEALEKSGVRLDKAPSPADFNGTEGFKKNLKMENKFSGSYKITGNITFSDIVASTDVEYKRSKWFNIPYGIESAKLTVKSDISTNLKVEGNLSEELTIAHVPIPLGPTGLSISVELKLYFNASGELVVAASVSNQASVEYVEGKPLKRSANSDLKTSIEVALNIDFGARLSASLDALGILKVVDVTGDVGGRLEAKAELTGTCDASVSGDTATLHYKEALTVKCDLYVPIIKISVGGGNTVIGALGLGGNWTIKGKGDATKIPMVDEEWVIWEDTITTDADDLGDEEEEPLWEDKTYLELDSYFLTLDGGSQSLSVQLHEDGEAKGSAAVTWSSSDPSVAKVNGSGTVTPVGPGSTTITATLKSDPSVSVQCTVYVPAPPVEGLSADEVFAPGGVLVML